MRDTKKESGICVISIYACEGQGNDDDKASGEELIADESIDLESEALRRIDVDTLRKALKSLDKEEMELITALYLSKVPMSESKLARKLGVRMCELRQIDLIIAKSISRFARNTKETLEYTRKLKLLGIGVMFEKEGINTLSLGDEMLLNTFAAIAQEESQAISQNVRLAIKKRMEMGEFISGSVPYGFRLINKETVVYEPEAVIVRKIYTDYLNGKSISEIAHELTAAKIPTKYGNELWTPAGITYILTNERYIGDSLYQKSFTTPTVPFTRHKNKGEEDMYYATGTHKPLIEKGIFDKVQILIQSRKNRFARTIQFNTYPLTSYIRCSECGSFFNRKVRKGCIKWVCSEHCENSKACDSFYYNEERIYDGFIAMVNKLRFGTEDIIVQTVNMLETAANTYKMNNQAARDMSQSIAELNANCLCSTNSKEKATSQAMFIKCRQEI